MSKRSADGDDQPPRKRLHQESSEDLRPDIWVSSEIPEELPPLPPITTELRTQVFTHRGLDQTTNYERLEWLGDAFIQTAASELIYHTFPHYTPGQCSQLREQLVRNATLAECFRAYHMEAHSRLPKDQAKLEDLIRTKPNDKEVIKMQGDMFEAYVGAISVSPNGRATAISWLKALWGRRIKDKIQAAEEHLATKQPSSSATGQNNDADDAANPKVTLARLVLAKGIRLRYEDIKSKKKLDKDMGLALFAVGVFLDGWGFTDKMLGHGMAMGKKEAGCKAAKMALENKKLMREIKQKRDALLETQGTGQEQLGA